MKDRVRTLRACAACSARKIKCDGEEQCSACRKESFPCFYIPLTRKRGPPKGCPARGGVRKKSKEVDDGRNDAERGAGHGMTVKPDGEKGQGSQQQPRSAYAIGALSNDPTTQSEYVPLAQTTAGEVRSHRPMQSDSFGRPMYAVSPSISATQTPYPFNVTRRDRFPRHPAAWREDAPAHSVGSTGRQRSPYSVVSSCFVPKGETAPPRCPSPTVGFPINSHFSPTPMVPSHCASTADAKARRGSLRDELSEEVMDSLLLIYETFIHTHWPVVYVPALRSLRSLERQKPLLFDAILAISAANCDLSDAKHSSQERHNMLILSEQLLQSVRNRVIDNLLGNGNLETVQALLLVSLMDLGYGRTSQAYHMASIACRMACDLGLHTLGRHAVNPVGLRRDGDVQRSQDIEVNRDGSRRDWTFEKGSTEHRHSPLSKGHSSSTTTSSPSHALSVQEEQKRTIWACFVLDKILASVSQRPPTLRSADIDTPRPSVMERDEFDLLLAGKAQKRFVRPSSYEAMGCVKSHVITFLNAWCDVMTILETILDQLYRPSAYRARYDAALGAGTLEEQEKSMLQIDQALSAWRDALPEHLQWRSDDVGEHINRGTNMLTVRGWFYTCKLLVHRPRVPLLDHSIVTSSLDPTEIVASFSHAQDADAIEALQKLKGIPLGTFGTRLDPERQRRDGGQASPRVGKRINANAQPALRRDSRLDSGLEASWHAARCICLILDAYEQTFLRCKLPSSWVYLVFQSGTVHAGLAMPAADRTSLPDDKAVMSSRRAESKYRLDQCIRWLDHISLTWASASHHVKLLRSLSVVGARARPSSPSMEKKRDVAAISPVEGHAIADVGQQHGHRIDVGPPSSSSQALVSVPSSMHDRTNGHLHTDQPFFAPPHQSTVDIGQANRTTFLHQTEQTARMQQLQSTAHGPLPTTATVNPDLLDLWTLFWGSMPTTSEDVSLWQDFSLPFQQQQQQQYG